MKSLSCLVLFVLGCAAAYCIRQSPTATGSTRRIALSSFEPQANALLEKMTLEEKIGQMTQADQEALKDVNDIQKYFLGSLLSGGNSDPKAGNRLQDWTEMYDEYQSHAVKTR